MASPTSVTCPASASWGCRSWPGSSNCSLGTCRFADRLTQQVADALDKHLSPKGVGVVIEAEHLCMSLRGVRATGSHTVTSALHGALRADARSRQEFFALAGVGH